MTDSIFKDLDDAKKYQLLYHAVEGNKKFLLDWIETDFVAYGSIEGGMDGVVTDALTYLKKKLFPKLNLKKLASKEEELLGVAEGIDMFIEWMGDDASSDGKSRAYAAATAIAMLFQILIDQVSEEQEEFYEDQAISLLMQAFLGTGPIEDDKIGELLDNAEDSNATDWQTFQKTAEEEGYHVSLNNFLNDLMLKLSSQEPGK